MTLKFFDVYWHVLMQLYAQVFVELVTNVEIKCR